MHAGYVADKAAMGPAKLVSEHVEIFLKYARDAVADKKRFVGTHTQIIPPGHASTTETADYVLHGLQLQRVENRKIGPVDGNLARVRCTGCKIVENRGQEEPPPLPRCSRCGELLRPDIVWFNEPLPKDVWAQADDAAKRCDCFLVVGTSGVVYPAAALVQLARGCGASAGVNVHRALSLFMCGSPNMPAPVT